MTTTAKLHGRKQSALEQNEIGGRGGRESVREYDRDTIDTSVLVRKI